MSKPDYHETISAQVWPEDMARAERLARQYFELAALHRQTIGGEDDYKSERYETQGIANMELWSDMASVVLPAVMTMPRYRFGALQEGRGLAETPVQPSSTEAMATVGYPSLINAS